MDSRHHRLSFTSSNATSSSSTPLGSSGLYGRSSLLSSDRYTRGTSVKLDLDRQAPRFHTSSRDTGIAESRHSNWKLPSSLTTPSVSCDRPWASSSAGSRTKLGDSERRPGMYSGLLSTTQDSDYKRPKLSYINRASYSRGPSTPAVGSTYSCFDSSWKSPSTRSRSSSSSSTTSEGLWARRDPEKRGESTYTPYADRATSSYAQGARPKETFYSSSRATGPVHHHRPSEYQSPLLSRDLCRTNPRTPVSASLRAQESAGAVPGPDPWSRPSRSRSWNAAAAPAANPSRGRSAESTDADGRCTTRQLLSRLASSMSSSLFSRRSSQDSSSSSPASRSFESSEDASEGREAEDSPPGRSGSPDTSERAGSNSPQGFAFLRRRRQGLPPLRETRRPPEADAGSWLSSSLRSRCPPLFSCRRREGRDETALSASRTSRCPLGRRDSAEGQEEEGQDDDDDDDEEEEATSKGAGVVGPSGATASTPASRSGRIRLPAIPNSLFQVSVAPSLESARPETVSVSVDIMAAGRNLPEGQKEKSASSRDPEKLRKIKESLLEESDEEEGDLCRICQMGEESASNPLIEPCRCTGSLQYVHQDCMKKWLRSKISSGSDLETIATCELCKEKLHLNIENFDINELYRTHERSEYEFISCGLYLVVLLHLCEQRFSDVLGAANDAGFFNLARTLHEHMDDLESSTGESDEELQDNRPSIDFGDLDDEEY